MNKKSILVLVLAFSFLASPVSAAPSETAIYKLPDHAREVAPNVFSLGTQYDAESHSIVEGYAFVHKKAAEKLDAKQSAATGKPVGASTCYAYIADGAKWKNTENFTVFAGGGLDGNYILSNMISNVSKWEAAAKNANIVGTGSLSLGTPSDTNILDNKNEVSFASITDSNTIAVTITWGIWSGPTRNRVLSEWDQIYNTNYAWSSAGEAGKMDFENIATHELGHAIGMDHPGGSSCTGESMYAYADYGETNKRDLNAGDIAGIDKLY